MISKLIFQFLAKLNKIILPSFTKKHLDLKRASKLSTRTYVFDKAELLSKSGVLRVLDEAKIDLVVLAGFLWKFPTILLDKYVNKVINIHPALLPKYGGKGMYGEFVHKAVVRNKETETGITIHFVNPNYDEGAIIFQAKCSIAADDDPVDVANKVHGLEMKYFPLLIKKILAVSYTHLTLPTILLV